MDVIGCIGHMNVLGFLVLRVTLPQCNMPYTGIAFPSISEVKRQQVCACVVVVVGLNNYCYQCGMSVTNSCLTVSGLFLVCTPKSVQL